jgi:hypothetical protein
MADVRSRLARQARLSAAAVIAASASRAGSRRGCLLARDRAGRAGPVSPSPGASQRAAEASPAR